MYAYTTQVDGETSDYCLTLFTSKRSEHRLRWLMFARVNLNALLVERPECVPEQSRRVILFLELNEALPVLSERGCDARWRFATSEELCMTIIVSIPISPLV